MKIKHFEGDLCPICQCGQLESYESKNILFLACESCNKVIDEKKL